MHVRKSCGVSGDPGKVPVQMKPYYEHAGITIYHGDCREILPQLPSHFDLVLTDPPYGSNTAVDNERFSPVARNFWDSERTHLQERTPVIGDDVPFEPAHLLAFKRLVLFGANHYASRLPDSGGWVVWDKRKGIEDSSWPLSEAELAWTNLCNGIRIFRHRWFGLVRETEQGKHWHPTQKPVALMRWILEKWTQRGDTVLDPYCGSGPVLQAAKEVGRIATGIEIEEKYCEIAAKRLSQEVLSFE